MTRSASCPECSAALTLSEEQTGKSIRCSNCKSVLKISAVRPKDEVVEGRPILDGERRRPAAVGDGQDESKGPLTNPGPAPAAPAEHRLRQSRQPGGVPVSAVVAALAAALTSGLAAGGGVAYLHWKRAAHPVVVNVPPAPQEVALLGEEPQTEPDLPLLAQGLNPELAPGGQAPREQPDPTLLAHQPDLARVSKERSPQKQPVPQPPRPGDGGAEHDAAPAGPAPRKERWQYLVVTLPVDSNRATAQLNRLAGQGWEYLGLINTSIPGDSVYNSASNEVLGGRGHESSVAFRRPKVPFYVPGAIEGESMKIIATSKNFVLGPENMAFWVLGKWSGDRQLNGQSRDTGDWADLELPAPAEGKYHIVVYLTRSPSYGVIQFYVNGTKLAKPIDCFHADTVGSTGAIDLGAANLKAGVNSLGVEVVGTNPKSTPLRYAWGLDCVVLKPAKK
jgi:hypothetical protein